MIDLVLRGAVVEWSYYESSWMIEDSWNKVSFQEQIDERGEQSLVEIVRANLAGAYYRVKETAPLKPF